MGAYLTLGVASHSGMYVILGGVICLRACQVAADGVRTRASEVQLLILAL